MLYYGLDLFPRWWDDDLTPMLLVGDSAELWLRAGWRLRGTVHGAVMGSTQLVLKVRRFRRNADLIEKGGAIVQAERSGCFKQGEPDIAKRKWREAE